MAMDPASILALTGTCVGLTYRLGVLTNNLYNIGNRYQTAEQSARLIISQLTALSAAVRALQTWSQSAVNLARPQLIDEIKQSLDSCDLLIQFVLNQLSEWQVRTDKMSFWHRAKYLWDESTVMRFEGMLRGQVQALSLLLQVKDFTSSSEQIAFLEDKDASTILRCARDDTSSLLWLGDTESTRTTTSMMTDNLEKIDVKFDFDELIVASKAYRSTLASLVKRRILRDNSTKAESTPLLDHANVAMPAANRNQASRLATSAASNVPQQFVIRRKPVATDDKGQPNRQHFSTQNEDTPLSNMITEASVKSDMNAAREMTTRVRDSAHDRPAKTTFAPVTFENASADDAEIGAGKTADFSSGLMDYKENKDEESGEVSDDFLDRMSSSPSIEDEDIDFELSYALQTFTGTVHGQLTVQKGDTLVLLDDSNAFWWLCRRIRNGSIGYLPAEHIETPTGRLARLNKYRNLDLSASTFGDRPDRSRNPLRRMWDRNRKPPVTFDETPVYIGTAYDYSEFDSSVLTELV